MRSNANERPARLLATGQVMRIEEDEETAPERAKERRIEESEEEAKRVTNEMDTDGRKVQISQRTDWLPMETHAGKGT